MLALMLTLSFLISASSPSGVNLLQEDSAPRDTIRYLALGDSYTIGTSLADFRDRFPIKIYDKLNAAGYPCYPPKIIAENGWTTGDLLKATTDFHTDSTFNLVSLLIGVNNQYNNESIEVYAEEFKALLARAIIYTGDDTSGVFVLSIPDYGMTPFGRKNKEIISIEIDQYNEVNKEIADSMGITYFCITNILRMATEQLNLVASDGLHPSGEMYELWVTDFIEEIKMKRDE